MNYFLDEYQCKCKEEFSIYNFLKAKEESKRNDPSIIKEDKINVPKDSIQIYLPSEGRQLFTRWQWSYPKPRELKRKTFCIKYEKPLSAIEKILLQNLKNKYLYHAIDDILSLKSKPIERNNLLSILYSPVLSLQNSFSIDFFDIWIDEVSISKVSVINKFIFDNGETVEPFSYITVKFLYTNKLPIKKYETLW